MCFCGLECVLELSEKGEFGTHDVRIFEIPNYMMKCSDDVICSISE